MFGLCIGNGSPGAFDHCEWIIQRPFQNVDEWLGPEGEKFRKHAISSHSISPKFHRAWAQFKTKYGNQSLGDILTEITDLLKAEGLTGALAGAPYLLGRAVERLPDGHVLKKLGLNEA